jgi:inner membrane protein
MKIEISDNKKWHQSLTVKIVLLGVLGVFLLIPLEMIKSIIKERQKNSEDVKKEIASQWAGPQNITGPVLNIPAWIYPSRKDAEPYKTIFHIMPETLNITGDINTETRHRSIYKAAVYSADLSLTGDFLIPEMNTGERTEILWNEVYYSVGISDNRGIKGSVNLDVDSARLEAFPGLIDADVFKSGITFTDAGNGKNKKIHYSMNFRLSGSESLTFSPVGKSTEVHLRSSWQSPGFTGNFLPAERTVDKSGFIAEWIVTNLNRNFPQIWTGSSYFPSDDSFGVNFILTVDHYQKSLRSAKYGILFIALTFLALLFAEMTIREKIHVFHYLLMSLGLVLFFSLLNALSEHTGFNLAYLISAVSTILLISFFLGTLIKTKRIVILISGLLVLLYSFIFVLLTLNDYAYLAGNIGLFILLAVTMRLSVKLNLFERETGNQD